jgi:hypothetical protein
MSHDDPIREALAAERAAAYAQLDPEMFEELVAATDAALESRPSLSVQSEEALAEAAGPLTFGYFGRDTARALIESGVVRVAPSLVAASREALIEHLVTIENDHWYDISESRNLGYYRTEITCACGAVLWWGGHDGDPHRAEVWNGHLADALLAPGGPVRVIEKEARG